MIEILGVWIAVMIIIIMFGLLFTLISIMINVFFKHLEKASNEILFKNKIKHYAISFVAFSLFVLLCVTFVMLSII